MTRLKLVNLLDDFALGGVSRGLGIFDSDAVRAVADAHVVPIDSSAMIAPRLDADVIVTHFTPNWRRIAFMATLRLRNPQARIVHVEHSYTGSWEALKVGNVRRFRAMLSLACRIPHRLVCVSHGQAHWLSMAAAIDPYDISVIYPYSDNPGIDALAAPDFRKQRPLRIGAYGRFAEAKGFDRLIAAHKGGLMPGCELILGGFGPQEAELRALADGAPDIRFYGKVENVADFLSQCDVVAVPSRWEAYGQVANEARQAGRPIIVSDIDGLAEQAGDAGMAIDFADMPSIAAAVARLTPWRLETMSLAARKATFACGWMRQRQWAQLIETIMPRERAGRRQDRAHAFA